MVSTAEEFVDNLLTEDALQQPSDKVKAEELELTLPKWFDEEKFNQARRFYWSQCYSFSLSMLLGLVAVFAVPSILQVLVGSRRSSSIYTAYRRYLSTLLHTQSWFEHELKPGSISWESLMAVRSRHVRAGLASKLKGGHTVSQRDIALTQFGFMGFVMTKPDKLGIIQLKEGDWEAYNHFWRVIGYMIGLEDRYNICRESVHETREVCQLLVDRVFCPCLENVPEFFEHMARVMLDGMWSVNQSIDIGAMLYCTRYLADVPGYMLTESDRIRFEKRLMEQLKGKPLDSGVDSKLLMRKPGVKGLPDRPPRIHYLRDYETLSSSPAYKELNFESRLKVANGELAMQWYTTYFGRLFFNCIFYIHLYLMKYFPYIAFIRFGIKEAMVNIFTEDPVEDTTPKPNVYYYEKVATPWYLSWIPSYTKVEK